MRRRTPPERRTPRPPRVAAPEGGVIALQHLAGNHAVSALVAREPSFGLYDDEEKAALKLNNDTMRLDDASVRRTSSSA